MLPTPRPEPTRRDPADNGDAGGRHLLLRWMIAVGVMTVGITIAIQQGLFAALFANDASGLSALIVGVFVVSSMHAGWVISRLSAEIDAASRIRGLLDADPAAVPRLEDGAAVLPGSGPVSGAVGRHLANLCRRLQSSAGELAGFDHGRLVDAVAVRVRQPAQTGWLIADIMIKLGLLGTVVGFILMLRSITGIEDVDIGTVQRVLAEMSGGMRIALFTTLSGLIGGMLAAIQYRIAETGADELVATLTEVAEVYVIPRLTRHLEAS
jgi:hypothetical protein